jgi:hypothetical protein
MTPSAPVIKKRYDASDVTGAEQRRDSFEDDYGCEMGNALETYVLFLRMYGDDI